MRDKLGLYLHIPFCKKKCNYCDFLTYTDQDGIINDYVDYLIKEIKMYKKEKIEIDTIYIGGGTPSYLHEKLMEKILQSIYSNFIVKEDCEVTIEMNPESITKEKIQTYLKNGVNRFSMGVQSFDNEVLRITGRIHNKFTVFKKLKLMRELGCNNISIDLMMANPKQNINILRKDLEIASKLDIDHISYYSLILKEHTQFEIWLDQGKIELFDPKRERDMYHEVVNTLTSNGFNQYEISSFSKEKKFESRHNKKYWTLSNYIGLGMGAASNIDLKRTVNTRYFDEYFDMIDNNKKPISEYEELSLEEREKEYIILSLRMKNGFSIKDINQKFNIKFLEKYNDIIIDNLEKNIIGIKDDHVFFTKNGIDNGNLFFRQLYDLD